MGKRRSRPARAGASCRFGAAPSLVTQLCLHLSNKPPVGASVCAYSAGREAPIRRAPLRRDDGRHAHANRLSRMPASKPAHLLIVEDEGDLLEVLKFVLEDAGYRISTAQDGAAALAIAASGKVSLVLLDVGMPDVDGSRWPGACGRIRPPRTSGSRSTPASRLLRFANDSPTTTPSSRRRKMPKS